MTVRELIDELNYYDENMEVVMKPSNSMYADGIDGANIEELRSFYGEDRDVLVICSSGQVGAV